MYIHLRRPESDEWSLSRFKGQWTMNDKGLGQFKEQVSHLKDVIGGGYPKF